jgi:hypothetical protein
MKKDISSLLNVFVLVPLLVLIGTVILLGKANQFPYFGTTILFTYFFIALLHINNFILLFRQVHHHSMVKKGLGVVCLVVAFFILFMQFGVVRMLQKKYSKKHSKV